jgi:hypothetical protein
MTTICIQILMNKNKKELNESFIDYSSVVQKKHLLSLSIIIYKNNSTFSFPRFGGMLVYI